MSQSDGREDSTSGKAPYAEALESIDELIVVIPRGGASEVGRSCYHVQTPELDVLVDCGLKQGSGGQFPDLRGLDQGQVDAVFLTHAHIDHSGGLPVLENRALLARDAPIISTRPTAALCHTLLHDSINIHEEQARRQSREQEFTRDNVHDVLERFEPHRYGEHDLSRDLPRGEATEEITYELGGSGHLLGSAWVSIEYRGRRVVFSGDVGGRSAHLPDWEAPPAADALFLESTYGDQQQHRSFQSARTQLYQETMAAVKRGKPVLIPTFAVGRAQEVMQIFRERFPHLSDDVRERLEVVYDGMAVDATAAYHAYSTGEFVNEKITNWRMNAQDNTPFLPDCAWNPEDTDERASVLDGDSAPIIIAPSGMLTGGTSPLYLTALTEHYDEARIFLIGYQAAETPGRELVEADKTEIDLSLRVTPFADSEYEADDDGNTEVTVPTSWVETISGFSGHGARQTLYEFAQEVDARHVALIHGPTDAQTACRAYLEKKLNADVVSRTSMGTPVPVYGASAGKLSRVDVSDGAANAVTVKPQDDVETPHVTDTLVDEDEPGREDDSQTNELTSADNRSLEERVAAVEDRLAGLESELTASRHEGRWTEADIRRLIREELDEETEIEHEEADPAPQQDGIEELRQLDGVGGHTLERLRENDYRTRSDLRTASMSELTDIDGIGQTLAERLLGSLHEESR